MKSRYTLIALTLFFGLLIDACSPIPDKDVSNDYKPVRLLDDEQFLQAINNQLTPDKYVTDKPLKQLSVRTPEGYVILRKPINYMNLQNSKVAANPPLLSANYHEVEQIETLSALENAESGWSVFHEKPISSGATLYPGKSVEILVKSSSKLEPLQIVFDRIIDDLDIRVISDNGLIADSESNFGTSIIVPPGILPAGLSKIRIVLSKDSPQTKIRSVITGHNDWLIVKGAKSTEEFRLSFNRNSLQQQNAVQRILDNDSILRKNTFPVDSPLFKPLFKSFDGRIADSKRAFAFLPSSELSYTVELPSSSAFLEFSVANEILHMPDKANLMVTIKSAGNSNNTVIALSRIGNSQWTDQRIDISTMAGEQVEIVFSYQFPRNTDDQDASIYIAEPIILARSTANQSNKNVIVISLDTLRGDRLPVNGYELDTMPFLSHLAQEGLNYSHAFSTTSWTLSSHKTIFTGFHHFFINYLSGVPTAKKPLPDIVPTFATYFKGAGYRTFGLCDRGYVSPEFGFDRDFDDYYQTLDRSRYEIVRDGKTRIYKYVSFGAAESWLTRNRNLGPFMMFLHTYSPHTPYSALGYEDHWRFEGEEKYHPDVLFPVDEVPESEEEILHLNRVYDRNLKRTDNELRTFFEFLEEEGILENTVVIITSDHGEQMGEHDRITRHGDLWQSVVHVPLVVYGAGIEAGQTSEKTIDLRSIVPTALEIANIPIPQYLTAPSLLNLSEKEEPILLTFLHNSHRQLAIVDDNLKLILQIPGKSIHDIDVNPLDTEPLDINDPETTKDAYRMEQETIIRFANLTPGWNLYIPNPKGHRLRVKLENIVQTDIQTNHAFTFEHCGIQYSFNNLECQSTGGPLLFCFEMANDIDAMIRIERWDDNNNEWVIYDEQILFQGISSVPAENLTVVSDEYPAIVIENIVSEAVNGVANLWHTRTPFMGGAKVDEAALSTDDINNLKDLGYLQ